MPERTAAEIADLLEEIGRRATFEAGNPYKAKAYVRAAASLRRLVRPLEELMAEGALQSIPGVGTAIARRIETLQRGGTDESLERMRQKLPAELLPLLSIPGLRPAAILKLHDLLGVSSMENLANACRQGQVAGTKGLGAALERKILQGLTIVSEGAGRLRMNQAQAVLDHTIAELARLRPKLRKITIAGDLRRSCELVSDLRLVAVDPQAALPIVEKFGPVMLHTCSAAQFGAMLVRATGNDRHVAQLESIAQTKGFTLSADGLHKGERKVSTPSEVDVYGPLGLPVIEPELREGLDEIARARKKRAPRLVTLKDLRGVLHLHTDFSDGVNTLEEMADAARQRGYAYLGVADHSQSAHYAGGLSLEQIDAQHALADVLNRRYRRGFRVLTGIESDILADGSLDYPPEVRARFDFVVASVHGRFRLGREEQTQRIITAVANPSTTILGHLTGRQLLRRPGYDVDIEAILKACARHGVAVEINSNPWRLELDWRWHRMALQLGCMLSINPDAHSTDELDLVQWGVAIARKGGVPKQKVLNALNLEDMLAYLAQRKMLANQPDRKLTRRAGGPRTHKRHCGR
ncbi:MAG: PHP domain-containing protein [Bacteroidota bacterium]